MPILRRILFPMVVFGLGCFLFWEAFRRYPVYVGSAVAIGIVTLGVLAQRRKKQEDQRGWRVGHSGRDAMYYEEFREGVWHRIEIDGEMQLVGKAHHLIYFRPLKFPDWALERRHEIVARIKSEFHPPHYEYNEA